MKLNKVKQEKKNKQKKKKAFTLIELLAVILILGVLMIIAIPSVTKYINDSRKNSYVSTAKGIITGVRTLIHSGKLDLDKTDTTYYIPAAFIKTENGLKSPYGNFLEDSAYAGVIFNEGNYKYYWISSDDAGMGVPNVTLVDKLDVDDIKDGLNTSDILSKVEITGIGNRTKIKILEMNGEWRTIELSNTNNNIPEDGSSNDAIPTIPSCPGCVFIPGIKDGYTSGYYNAGDIVSPSDYTLDYREAVPEQYSIFLGLKLNPDGTFNKAYVCGLKKGGTNDGNPYCIQGAGSWDDEIYNNNFDVLSSATLWYDDCYSPYSNSISCVDTIEENPLGDKTQTANINYATGRASVCYDYHGYFTLCCEAYSGSVGCWNM